VVTATNGLTEVPDVFHRSDASLAGDQKGLRALLANDDWMDQTVLGDARGEFYEGLGQKFSALTIFRHAYFFKRY